MQSDDLGVSIVKGACNSETKDLTVELAELGLDTLLDEGVLKEIPVLKAIIACRKTWTTIHDQVFLRKVAGFLLACPKFTEADKEGFAKEHLSDPKKAKHLGDSVAIACAKRDEDGETIKIGGTDPPRKRLKLRLTHYVLRSPPYV